MGWSRKEYLPSGWRDHLSIPQGSLEEVVPGIVVSKGLVEFEGPMLRGSEGGWMDGRLRG